MSEIKMTGVPETEFSLSFVQGMADRMGMSFRKYGAVADAYPHKVDAIASLKLRLDKYAETGNTEYLIDASNFAMIEWMYPRRAGAFFEPTDASGSPGRVSTGGNISQAANTVEDENRRLGGSARRTDGGFYSREGD
jgi:hypothetical protein